MQLREHHPWLSSEVCRIVLTSYYLRFNRAGVGGQQLQTFMDDTTDSLCKQSREEMKDTLALIQGWH